MTEGTKPFSRVVTRLTKSNDVLWLDHIPTGNLLTIKLGPPGYACLVIQVASQPDSAYFSGLLGHPQYFGKLFGRTKPGTRLTSHTEQKLLAEGCRSFENLLVSIIGSCDFRSPEESFYQAISTNDLKVGRCVLWAIYKRDEVVLILSPGRISEIEVRTT